MRAEFLIAVLLTSACAVDGTSHPPLSTTVARTPGSQDSELEPEDEFEEEVRDGAWLYERNCSGCHGMSGAGDGETGIALGVQPRDFAAGGFSFGNTPEDLLRTVSAGIPGRSVMPAFGGLLSDEERRSIVEHVLTLMPAQERSDPAASVLHVGERAAVARGKLPPAAAGRPELPRGLLLGLPSGLTFEYDVEDVAPVAVRLGAFADREDWRGRGGGYLRPLGQPIYLCGRESAIRCGGEPAEARLTASWSEADLVGLEYDVIADGRVVAKVVERLRAVPLSVGGAFERELEVTASTAPASLDLYLAGDERTRFERSEGRLVLGPRDLGPDDEGDVEAVWLDLRYRIVEANFESGALRAKLDLGAGAKTRFAVVVLLIPDDSPARLAALAEELTR